MSVVVLAFDDAIAPSSEGATHEKVLGVAREPAREVSSAETSALVGFALAFPTFAKTFGGDARVSDDANARARVGGVETSVARCADARFACARAREGSVWACARASEAAAATWRRSDEALRTCVRTVVLEGERLMRLGESRAVAWECAVRAGLEALREEEAGASGEATAPDEADGFEKYVAFYGVESEGENGALRMRRVASESSKRVHMDARTVSTLAQLRRDLRSEFSDDVEHVFIKPGHEAWVCAGSRDGERAYIVVEDTSDTLLRAVKGAKTFAEKAFPGAFNLELDFNPLSRANSM